MLFLYKLARKVLGKIPFMKEFLAFKYFFQDANSKKSIKLLMWLPLIYFVSPVDFIPDIFAVFGYFDDIGIIALSYKLIKKCLKHEHIANAKDWFDGKNYSKDDIIHLNKDEWTIK